MKGLRGRSVLVTGAGRGIGRGIAVRAGAEGMGVIVNDLKSAGANETVAMIADAGGTAVVAPGDVGNEGDARRLVATAIEAFGELFGLVNCAGVDIDGPVATTTRERWDAVHDVDLWAIALLVREAEQALVSAAGGGRIVNIASNHAVATIPNRSIYAAAKAGAVGLSRALAVELGPRGVRSNLIMPGYIETPIWDLWLDKAPDPQGLLRSIAARHPVRRLGKPDDVAGMTMFLLSDDAGFITGTEFMIDGGYTAQLEPPTV
jgi:NAD(P)-dependent dehydrogenase (short-subunit alcohol dehydrogenase family)